MVLFIISKIQSYLTFMNKLIIVLLLYLPVVVQAQYFEFGLQGGIMNYQGDLTPESLLLSVGESHSTLGGYVKYNITPRLSARINMVKGTISGNDRNADSEGRRRRGLDFTSPLYELAVIGEWNLFRFTPNSLRRSFTPYIMAGVAGFRFNPQTEYLEQYIDLQTLGTEGQGLEGYAAPYELQQLSIPFGGGLKCTLNEEWTIGIEVGARKTFTDHLDDVGGYYVNYNELLDGSGSLAATLADRTNEYLGIDSPIIAPSGVRRRGNPDNQDWYLIGVLTISYNLIYKGIGTSSLKSAHFGCPKKF